MKVISIQDFRNDKRQKQEYARKLLKKINQEQNRRREQGKQYLNDRIDRIDRIHKIDITI